MSLFKKTHRSSTLAIGATIFLVASSIAIPSASASDISSEASAAEAKSSDDVDVRFFEAYEALSELISARDASMGLGGLIGADEQSTEPATLVVPWVGAVPTWLAEGAAHIERNTGIDVTTQEVSNTHADLMSAAETLHSLLPEAQRSVTTVGIRPDSLIIRGPEAVKRLDPGNGAVSEELAREVAALERERGMRVSFEDVAEEPIPAARTGDVTNFHGGANYWTSTPAGFLGCTTGFPAQLGTQMFILTAAHCSGYLDSRIVHTSTVGGGLGAAIGVTDYIWEIQDNAPAYDLGLVRLDSGLTNAASVYADPGFSTVTVRGYSAGMPAGGNYCSSGVVTQYKCNILTQNQEWVCYGSECQWVIRVTSTNGAAVFCKGDSGGPIFYHHLGLSSPNVIAAGIVSGILAVPGASCGTTGFASVVSSAVSKVPGLQIRYVP